MYMGRVKIWENKMKLENEGGVLGMKMELRPNPCTHHFQYEIPYASGLVDGAAAQHLLQFLGVK